MMENEVTYLIAAMPPLEGLRRAEIEQHYLSSSPEPLRIRATDPGTDGSSFELTKKLHIDPNDKSRKREINVPLTADEFAELRGLTKRALTKTRYRVPLDGGLVAELDIFHGPLEGLRWVEVEFPDEDARAAFVPPDWFGRDITQESWSSNSKVAGKTYEALIPHIEGRPDAPTPPRT